MCSVSAAVKHFAVQQKNLQLITIGHGGKYPRQFLTGHVQETYFISVRWEPIGVAEMKLYTKIM